MSAIDDSLKGIDACNRKIQELEILKGECKTIADKLKVEYEIKEYYKILQHFIHEAHQEGRTRKDITQTGKKRFNG